MGLTLSKIYKNDVGTVIRIDMLTDITTATTETLYYKKPSGSTGQWTPSISGTNYYEYQVVAGDLDEVGTYLVQPYLEIGDFEGYGDTVQFTVLDQFE